MGNISDRKHILISVDGLNAEVLKDFIKNGKSVGFQTFLEKGAYTYDAKTDPESTLTLPNHTSMFTSMSVKNHGVKFNSDQKSFNINFQTVFDVLKEEGKTSAMYVGKDKFNMFRNKVNMYYLDKSYPPDYEGPSVARRFIKDVGGPDANQCNLKDFTFIHFLETDRAGHLEGWDSEEYRDRLSDIDKGISKIIRLADILENMCKITIILTSDHGGTGKNHGDSLDPKNFNVPFFVYHNFKDYGDKNNEGRDLYDMNIGKRTKFSSNTNPSISESKQPIRPADVGNLIAEGGIEGSDVNKNNDLII